MMVCQISSFLMPGYRILALPLFARRVEAVVNRIARRNAVWGTVSVNRRSFASVLPTNFKVGANHHFRSRVLFFLYWWDCNSSTCGHRGPWHNIHDHYLGFKFMIDGQIHYGW